MNTNDSYYHYQLMEYQRDNVLVSLCVEPDNPDDFIAGYIAHVGSQSVALNAVTPAGRYDGLICVKYSEISSMLGMDEYSERLRILLLLRGETPRETLNVAQYETLFHAMCRLAQEENKIITLWCGDSEYVGRIVQLDDMRVVVSALDFFGQNPVNMTLLLRDVTMASLGSDDDDMFDILSRAELRTVD